MTFCVYGGAPRAVRVGVITKVANDLIDEGWEVDPVDLATVTPYITSKTRRFGTWHLDMEPPENEAVGRLRMAA